MGGVWGWILGKIRTCSDTKYDVYECWIGWEMEKEGYDQREMAHSQERKKARVERFREWCEIEGD